MRILLLFAAIAGVIIAAGGAPAASAAAPGGAGSVQPSVHAVTVREAAVVCGNVGCYTPQTKAVRQRKLPTLGQPLGHG